jgi:hypothetical protein
MIGMCQFIAYIRRLNKYLTKSTLLFMHQFMGHCNLFVHGKGFFWQMFEDGTINIILHYDILKMWVLHENVMHVL